MPKTKPGFTREQHNRWGRIMKRQHAELTSFYVEFANAYPLQSQAAMLLHTALRKHEAARCAMDRVVCLESPQGDRTCTRVYYGKPDGAADPPEGE